MAVFVVWSDQLGGERSNVPEAATLMPDARARHYWDGDRVVGSAFQPLALGDDTVLASEALWDTYLLFDRDARWPAGAAPPQPVWWEHQLRGLPIERRLDARRFAAKAAELAAGAP